MKLKMKDGTLVKELRVSAMTLGYRAEVLELDAMDMHVLVQLQPGDLWEYMNALSHRLGTRPTVTEQQPMENPK